MFLRGFARLSGILRDFPRFRETFRGFARLSGVSRDFPRFRETGFRKVTRTRGLTARVTARAWCVCVCVYVRACGVSGGQLQYKVQKLKVQLCAGYRRRGEGQLSASQLIVRQGGGEKCPFGTSKEDRHQTPMRNCRLSSTKTRGTKARTHARTHTTRARSCREEVKEGGRK